MKVFFFCSHVKFKKVDLPHFCMKCISKSELDSFFHKLPVVNGARMWQTKILDERHFYMEGVLFGGRNLGS